MSDDMAPGLERCLSGASEEAAYEVTEIDGAIPAWLRGTYYINGPAQFEVGDLRYKHWLDCDGMVCSVRFADDGVSFASRFVGTRKRSEESAAGRALFRGFGTTFPGDQLRRGVMLEPPVNVSVYPYAGKLLALGEQAVPIELDPATLETRGEYDFHEALNEATPFAAHAKIDQASGHLVNFGVAYGGARNTLNLYEFDDAGRQIYRNRIRLETPYTIHDFGLSDRFAVFHVGTYLLRVEKFLAGESLYDALDYDDTRQSRLLLAPRQKRAQPIEIPIEGGYCLHFVNCFERDESLVVDVIDYDRPLYPEYTPLPDLFQDVSKGRPVRYVVDLRQPSVVERIELDYDCAPDFPSVSVKDSCREYSEFYCLGISEQGRPGRKFFDQLARISWADGSVDSWQAPRGEYVGGEPVCIRGPGAESAIIVESFQPGSDANGFLIFDGRQVGSGPIARIGLRSRISPGFHASFHPV